MTLSVKMKGVSVYKTEGNGAITQTPAQTFLTALTKRSHGMPNVLKVYSVNATQPHILTPNSKHSKHVLHSWKTIIDCFCIRQFQAKI